MIQRDGGQAINVSRWPWLTAEGMWTDGNSMRHEASLRARASRRSFFSPRWPTPNERTRAAATRTSCPCCRALPAILTASVQVSSTTRPGARFPKYRPSWSVRQRFSSTISPTPLRTHTWLSPASEIDADMFHGGLLLSPVSRTSSEAGHFILSDQSQRGTDHHAADQQDYSSVKWVVRCQ